MSPFIWLKAVRTLEKGDPFLEVCWDYAIENGFAEIVFKQRWVFVWLPTISDHLHELNSVCLDWESSNRFVLWGD